MTQLTKKLKLKITSYNPKILTIIVDSFKKEFNNDYVLGPYRLPVRRKVFCVLRSPFINKDSRDHFEIKKHSVFFVLKFTNIANIIKFLKLTFKKFSFEFANNIYINIEKF